MKSFSKFVVIPALCQALLLAPAMAEKKDKADDSDGDKPAKREQAGGGKKNNGGGGGGAQRPNQGGGGGGGGGQNKKAADPTPAKKKQAPQTADRPAKPKANPTPAPAKKKDPEPAAQRSKAENNQANKGKDSRPDNNQANKGKDSRPDNNQANKARDNDSSDKGRDSAPNAGGKKEPMPLPGKRPEMADRDGKDNKGGGDKNDKASNRQENNEGKTARSEDRARNNKQLDLPGKRPAVQRVTRDDRPDDKVSGRTRNPRDPNAKESSKVVRREPVVRPGQNTRQVRRVNVDNSNTSKAWYNNRRVTNNNNTRIVNNTTVINNNFRRNVNWSTRRHDWGYNPWWNRPQVRPWYGSTWNFGWNRDYYHRHYYYGHSYGYRPPGYAVSAAIGWGLVGWSLGTLAYDTGYYSYYNPYPVRTQVVYRGENFSYDRPIARVAVETAPDDDDKVADLTAKSESIIAESQTAFKQQNYLVALELADKAIAETPGDGALHEYRALVLFALGKYGDAAGVLNPVLASGPGWDWSTMVALYPSQQVYTDQLQRLEDYTEKTPDAADTHFLLGYHYMVCGHLDLATPQFELAAKLMPKDSVSRQLADLTRSSTTAEESESAAESTDTADDTPEPEVVPVEKLEGTWTSVRDDGGSVKLTFKKDGKFTWSYQKDGKDNEFSGDYSMNDNGQLVLDSEETQMVATVDLPQESEMKFVLAGGPPEDPGLAFKKG